MRYFRLAVGALLALAGCRAPEAPVATEILHLAHEEDVQSWDPAVAFDEASLDVLSEIYERSTSTTISLKSTSWSPSWPRIAPPSPKTGSRSRSPSGRGARFADDSVFWRAAHASVRAIFVYALKRLALPSWARAAGGFWRKDPGNEGVSGEARQNPEKRPDGSARKRTRFGLSAENDSTLVIRLAHPVPQIEHLLAMTFTAPMPSECAHPVGTRAFLLKSWAADRGSSSKRNPRISFRVLSHRGLK